MKKITTLICLCVLIAAFAFMFIFSVCLPRTTVSDYSYLKEWPEFTIKSFFSGDYFKDVMYCFTDTINSRDKFIDYEARISTLYGIKDDEQLFGTGEEANKPEESLPESQIESTNSNDSIPPESTFVSDETVPSVAPDETSEPEFSNTEGEKQDIELSGDIYIIGNRALEIYYGNEANAAKYAGIMNNFAKELKGVANVYSMVIPKSSAYYLGQASNEKFANLALRNKRDIDIISNALSEDVIDVNIYNTLGLHANEDIYFRTDHHWTPLGAYYASAVFSQKAGVDFADISTFTENVRSGYVGTYYKYSNYDPKILNNPEDFHVYYPDADYTAVYYSPADLTSNKREHDGGFFWDIPDNQRSSWYSTYIRGDSYSVHATSNECKNGRKLLIVKDSYGNALAPYMLQGFEEILIVDARNYNVSLKETVEKYGITDVLFAQCALSAVSSDTKPDRYLYKLKELCK